jgi:uncharacterized membrane protein
MHRKSICIGVGTILGLGTGVAHGQQIYAIGDLPGGNIFSTVAGVTDTGLATGLSRSANNEFEAYIWSRTTGITGLGTLPGEVSSRASAISSDGTVIVGESGSRAMRWTLDGGMQPLGSIPNGVGIGSARDVSHDGSVIVGDENTPLNNPGYESFRWTEQTGPVSLGVPSTRNRATAISGNGNLIAGYDDISDEAFSWTASSGLIMLSNGGVIDAPRPRAASWDGSVIVGGGAGPEAFRWTESSGMVSLGRYTVNDMSDDGNIIVGSEFFASEHRATLWTESGGWRLLRDILTQDYDMDLTGWTLNRIEAISPNGQIIAGTGVDPDGNSTGYVVIIPNIGTFAVLAFGCLGHIHRSRRSLSGASSHSGGFTPR